jgi:plastocyanin
MKKIFALLIILSVSLLGCATDNETPAEPDVDTPPALPEPTEMEVPAPGVPPEDVDDMIVVDDPNTDAMLPVNDEPADEPQQHTVTISDSGYAPSILSIKSGDTVTFVNEGSRKNWPATNAHPTHTNYPGSDIKLCGSTAADEVFDACRGLENGESFSFIFTETGTWNYHNHLSPGQGGSIIVE